MASRGAKAQNNHITTDEYETIKEIGEIKILGGKGNSHSLPDYSHTANTIYAKLNFDGSIRELRIYENHKPIIEFGYHPEPTLNNGDREHKILHYHTFNGIERNKIVNKMTIEIKEKYKEILMEANLYDKC